ncbi:HAD family hydrolase [Streptomyces thermodiastaticus]|uniref:HAD family hydrolase n=1 Tax=Streptomyces thermodiastaticus TaxID=44061 RepID=UPI00199CC28D|nr:HAD family hydrolase [Streptomyces thermodiastaticus]MCE7550630.1 HAD family hydrolase [Streptomyces thermodiastaticus]GHF70689.1 hydrolase [Streptomyces thermodiastaticus]
MTSDQTHTEGAAARSAAGAGDLRSLIEGARVVLWDFDGPVCRLFARHSAERVAKGMVDWLAGRGLSALLPEDERQWSDPHAVLRTVAERRPGSDLVTELEARLTAEERRAADSAWPTPYADPLIRTWTARGRRLAVATNNSPVAVRSYLASRGLDGCFAPHVYGRTRELHRLKPDPYCLDRALNATGAAASEALMIGDSPSDLEAAVRAGVPFLGCVHSPKKARLLRKSGATVVVDSLEPVLRIVRGQA